MFSVYLYIYLSIYLCRLSRCVYPVVISFLHLAQKDFSLISDDPSACTLASVVATSVQYFNEQFKTQMISTSIILVLEVGDILLSLYDFHKLRLTVNAANSNQGFTLWESSVSE
jgi:hypothetical protein